MIYWSLTILSVVSACIVILQLTNLPTAFAHNENAIILPISRINFTLDGNINEDEWKDAFKTNFTSPTSHGNVIVYLKYEASEQALDGAFTIADDTPSTTINKLDQISFLFDPYHSGGYNIQSDDQQIVFARNTAVEYYYGTEQGKYKLISNSTGPINLHSPFSKVAFKIISEIDNWRGEFKIYFNTKPSTYGFAIQQTDYYGSSSYSFINFPYVKTTDTYIPNTWGDITFFDFSGYSKNIKKFCQNSQYSIAPDSNDVLCIKSISPFPIEEKTPTQLVIDGSFGNLISGTGIADQEISLSIANKDNMKTVYNSKSHESTDVEGAYHPILEDVNLPNGLYNVIAKPTSSKYVGLNATALLQVNKHVTTIDEFLKQIGTYFGVITAGLTIIPISRFYFYIKAGKQRNNLCAYIMKINAIYNKSDKNKEDCLNQLANTRDEILGFLNKGKINEEQYDKLDKKITDYEEKINKQYT
jgi:hypothetical protein